MPCLSGQFNPQIGPLTNIALMPVGTAPSAPTASPVNISQTFIALIDTGATTTCITPAVAQLAGLQPIGRRPMISATHETDVNVYLADIFVPFGNLVYSIPGLQVMEFATPPGSPFQMLLGRDVICSGVLTLSFDGAFTFSL